MLEIAGIAYRHSEGGGTDSGPPPLVLIHGAGGSSLHWPPHLRHLRDVDVYALDLPGHGESRGSSATSIEEKVKTVVSWARALELPPSVFAGHSMGGAIAQTLALAYPKRVAGLILVGTGGRLRVHPEILSQTATQEGYESALETIMTWSFSDSADPRLVKLASDRMSQVPAHVLHADYLACDGFDVLPRLGNIDCPTLVICGSADRLTPLKYSQYLTDHISGAELGIIEGAGHMVMLEQPEAVVALVLPFMETLTGG